LLAQIDGRETREHGRISSRGLTRVLIVPTAVERLLDQLAEPTLTSLLLSLGMLGILYELSSPGIGAGWAVGALLLVLGLLGSSVLALETTALALFVIGFAAIALEVKLPTHGVLAGVGLVALLLGATLLVDPDDYFGGVARVRLSIFAPVMVT